MEDATSFEELMADFERHEEEERHLLESILEETRNLQGFVLRDASRTRGVLISPSARKEGMFQASFFDERGFFTDTDAPRKDSLIREAVREYQMTERDDAFLEELARTPTFCRLNALSWYRQQGTDETAVRELRIISPPVPDEKGVDPLLGAFCRAYQQELEKRHISLIPGQPARLGSDKRTAITEAVTKRLLRSRQLTAKTVGRYADVLCFADPGIRRAEQEDVRNFVKRIMERASGITR